MGLTVVGIRGPLEPTFTRCLTCKSIGSARNNLAMTTDLFLCGQAT